ncbi:MAG: malonyl-ACP O-methyltransferase BioC [Chromatiales bacterium]|jgi:malonyl-CoA O-methyltransferase
MAELDALRLDKRRLRAKFNRAASGYDEAAVLQHEVAERMQERLDLIKLKPRIVLDVGAGTGFGSFSLLRRYRGASVLALDLASEMLREIRRRSGWLRRPLLVGGDAEDLPLSDGRVDLLWSNLTLQWCNDLDRAFAEFRRVMGPGGLLMFSTFGPDTLKELRGAWAQADRQTHVNAFIDMHDIGDALLRAGFADPVMDVETITMTYRDVRALMRDLKQIGAANATRGRPRAMTGRGRLARVEAAYETSRRPDGLLPATYEVVYGHAWAPEGPPPARPPGRPVPIPIRAGD